MVISLPAICDEALQININFCSDYSIGLMIGCDVPINRRYTVLAEIGVGLGKWRAAKKSVMCGQWRGMGTG